VSFIGLDLGRKRVGVALSHGVVAEAVKTLPYDERNTTEFIKAIKDIIREQRVKTIVVGLPLGKNGKDTDQSIWTQRQVEDHLVPLGLKIEFVEESFSTSSASDLLESKNRKALIDSYSAKIILEQFLNENRSSALR